MASQLSTLILVKICMIFEHLSSKIQLYQSQYRLKRGKKDFGQSQLYEKIF